MYRSLLSVALLVSMLAFSPSCKNHKSKSERNASAALDSAVAAAVDSVVDLSEMDVEDEVFSETKRYNPSATRINDIIHTRLEVSFDIPNEQLFGKAMLEIKPYFYPADSLILDAQEFDIKQIAVVNKDGSLSDLQYKNDRKQLHIYLGKTYTRNESYKISLQYTANPSKVKAQGSAAISDARGLYFINPKEDDPAKPTQIWTQGETQSNSCWFPTIDRPNEKMTEEILITVQDRFKTLSNGILVSTKKNADGTRTDHWKMDLPHAPYLVMMAIGEYSVVKDTWRKIPVDYYVEKEFEPYARKIFGHTPEMLEFFSKRLGVDYPWPKYSQIVARDYVSGAMENTSATLFGEFVQQTPNEMLDNDFESVIAHELFHHWFGDLVTCESWSNLPLNESFATYSEYLWFENKYGRDEADHHLQNDLKVYLEEASQKRVNLIRFDYDSREDMFDRHSYQKGGLVLHMLRKYVGDDAFFEALKVYLTDNKFQAAEIHNLRLAFEKVTGEDLNWFFNQWFLDKGHPNLSVQSAWNDTTSTVLLSFFQNQNPESSPIYKLPVDIDIYEKGKARRVRIIIDSVNQQFSLSCAAKPDYVNVDAEKMLLATLSQENSVEEAQYQYLHAPLYLDRYQAVNRLLEATNEPGVMEFLKMTLRDKFWNIRLRALVGMEEMIAQSPAEYREVLVQLARTDKKSAVRAEAISQMKIYSDDSEVFGLFETALHDSSSQVQSAALGVMYSLNPEKAKAVIQSLESTATGDLLASIATIYASAAIPGKFEYLSQTYDGISDPNEKYIFIQLMGKYALSQEDGTAERARPKFEQISRKASAWYLRLSGIQVLAEYKNVYDSKIDGLNGEISAMKEKGAAVSAVQQKELEIIDYRKKLKEIEVMFDTIRAEETDPNLVRLLNMVR
jgi:aminopeptidase N